MFFQSLSDEVFVIVPHRKGLVLILGGIFFRILTVLLIFLYVNVFLVPVLLRAGDETVLSGSGR